jgi:DDE superfamily endonuclease
MTISTTKPVIIPKSIMPTLVTKSEFQGFREQLYNEFEHQADSKIDLLDALCSNNHSPSVVQLSLNPLFRRGYSALFKAIGGRTSSQLSEEDDPQPEDIPLQQGDEFQFLDLIAQVVPIPKKRHFLLMGQDCTTIGRPFAKTLEDRGIVHQPTVIRGNKPITIGHSYSLIAVLPERSDEDAPWTIPLDMSRVPTESNSTHKGIAQVNAVLSNPNMPWTDELCVLVVDSAYGNHKFLTPLQEHKNLVVVARSRSNRVFYQRPIPSKKPPSKGHPTWYGERFDFKNDKTWHEPNEVDHTFYQTRRGRTINVTIKAWHNMLMRGSKKLPTHQYPFTILRIVSVDESGKSIFKPMWLIVMGDRRDEISAIQTVQAYRQRFDLEHTFRFKKQNLLLSDFETPQVEHEQQWVQLVMLAYGQLWAAHDLAVALPRPWESDIKPEASARMSPSKVQQDWYRIISQLGTPAAAPKPRGISPGRQLGHSQTPRPRFPVVKKTKSKKTVSKIAA